jgi:hypothetical protein
MLLGTVRCLVGDAVPRLPLAARVRPSLRGINATLRAGNTALAAGS